MSGRNATGRYGGGEHVDLYRDRLMMGPNIVVLIAVVVGAFVISLLPDQIFGTRRRTFLIYGLAVALVALPGVLWGAI